MKLVKQLLSPEYLFILWLLGCLATSTLYLIDALNRGSGVLLGVQMALLVGQVINIIIVIVRRPLRNYPLSPEKLKSLKMIFLLSLGAFLLPALSQVLFSR